MDFGAENYGALDSGNLLSTKRPEASSDVRREHSCWASEESLETRVKHIL